MRRAAASWVGASAGLVLVAVAHPASAEQVLVQGDHGQVALDAYTAPATLGGRAEVALNLGALNANLKAAMERGGASPVIAQPWTVVSEPAEWKGDQVQLGAQWAPTKVAKISLDASDQEKQTLHYGNPLVAGSSDQYVTDQSRSVHVDAAASGLHWLELHLGGEAAETSTESVLTSQGPSSGTTLLTDTRKLTAGIVLHPLSKVTVEAGEALQTLGVSWRSGAAAVSDGAYQTPRLAVTVTPWSNGTWSAGAEQTVAPIDPGQFAAYAQLAGATSGPALQPNQGWRYTLGVEQQFAPGLTLSANLLDWRFSSVTEFGPVAGSEAPVSIGGAERRKLDVSAAAPLDAFGLRAATLSGQVTWAWSQVADPFTGAVRPMSGDTPYQAQLKLSGSLPAPDLSWALTAQASGPQSVYQMSQITTLSPTAGLGAALTYGEGPLTISLEVDNLIGGQRTVTNQNYLGSRADNVLADVNANRQDDRAIRIALKRRL